MVQYDFSRPQSGKAIFDVIESNGPFPVDASLHDSILADIRQRVLSGSWQPGFRIPIETDLALHYGCSRMTVNKAMTQLANAGLIERRKKAGSFVLAPRSQSALLELQDVKDDVAAMGRPYRFVLSGQKTRLSSASDITRLGLKKPGQVMVLTCLHFAGNAPYCHEDRLINLEAVPAAREQKFDDIAPGRWLIQHVAWTEAEHRIRAETPTSAIARILALAPGEACLVLERLTWRSGTPLTDVLLTYPASMRELIARFTPSKG
jgi:GntR family transcriptional regulator, histidine utilization repressor